MRLDKYLKVSRIIKRRTVANEACAGGRVEINGRVAKPGAEVKPGDRITISTARGSVTVKANPTAVMPAGMVSLYHGYREADANSLLSWDHRDPYSGFPGYRCIRCRVEKEAEA